MTKWTTIKLPQSLAKKVRDLAEKEKLAQWQVILRAIEVYEQNRSKSYRLRNPNQLDKISYYIMKLSYSVSVFKKEPTQENLQWLEKTVEQIKQRLGVDISYLLQVAKVYARTRSKEDYVELNMAWKLSISDLISLLFS